MARQNIQWLIKNRLVAGQPEGETSRVWNCILNFVFPVDEGFSTGPEMPLRGNSADLFTAHMVYSDSGHEDRKFLVVECQAPGTELQADAWKEAADQLRTYAQGLSHNDKRFGVIAIGKAVRFYEMDGHGLKDYQDDGGIYRLDRQCQTVTQKLLSFKDSL